MQFVRQYHGAIVVDECLYIVGGQDNSNSKYLTECETFDHQTNSTDPSMMPMTVARSNFGICHSLDKQ